MDVREKLSTEKRLIDANALRAKCDAPHWCVWMSDIDDAPTVDAVEVVRCRDCKYWQDNNGGYPHDECRWGKGETPDADDFCSYGERKEGAD